MIRSEEYPGVKTNPCHFRVPISYEYLVKVSSFASKTLGGQRLNINNMNSIWEYTGINLNMPAQYLNCAEPAGSLVLFPVPFLLAPKAQKGIDTGKKSTRI